MQDSGNQLRTLSSARGFRAPFARQDPMDDDRILRVLEEMRDLQRQNLANYQDAVRNQQESIRLQKAGLRRVRLILGLATIVLVIAVAMLVMLLLRAVARLP
jgi:hypothetical protein